MKFRDVQRSVRAQRYDRSVGDAPVLGKVTRVSRGASKSKRRRRRRSEGPRGQRQSTRKRRVVLVWSSVFAALTLGLVVVSVWTWVNKSKGRGAADPTIKAPGAERVASRFESPAEEEALDLVRKALAIRDEKEVPNHFRQGGASPSEVVGFLRRLHETDGEPVALEWLSSMDANGMLLDGVMVSHASAELGAKRLAFLTPNEKGRWLVDFEAFARVATPSWQDLLQKGAPQAIVRVLMAGDNYFNGPFREEEGWLAYGLASPDIEEVLTGYVRKGSPQAEALSWIFSNEHAIKRATLEIRRVEGGGPRQFEISRVLAEDWVVSGTPFDETGK